MFTFQSIMFVSLGFLFALLLGFVVAPAFWSRAVRLTTERMRATLPLTEQEISADRDRLRAENAIRVHQLTAKIEQARLYDARQRVEINRRDGTISSLERRLQLIETEREGSENARRVLEATINQRVPEVESRLMEARQLLAKRDAEMKALQSDTGRTYRALDDAMQVNAQQRAEIDRLQMSLAGHGARPQNLALGGETEAAMRAELESVRARSREQAALIKKLQGSRSGAATDKDKSADASPVSLKEVDSKDDAAGWDAPLLDEPERAALQAETDDLKAKLADKTVQIETLSAQLAAYEEGATSKSRSLSLRETKTALKARASASDKALAASNKTITSLRRELATANERLAKQASYYQDELRRLGASGGGRGSGQLLAAATARHGKRAVTGSGATPEPVVDGELLVAAALEAKPLSEDTKATDSDAGAAVGAKQSLEARLAAADAPSDAPARDFDQHEAADEDPKQPRTKLMDRIAGLAKR